MEKITTHVLDTSTGKPAAGVQVRLFHGDSLLAETQTNQDGRCHAPLALDPAPGNYQLVFSIGDYFRSHGTDSPFLNEVPIHFTVQADESYHVPLLCTPWSYSTYRGS